MVWCCLHRLRFAFSFQTHQISSSESSAVQSYVIFSESLRGGAPWRTLFAAGLPLSSCWHVARVSPRCSIAEIRFVEVFCQSLVTGVIAVAEVAHTSPDPEATLWKPLKTQIERASRVQFASLKAPTASPPGQGSYGQPPKPRSNDCQKTSRANRFPTVNEKHGKIDRGQPYSGRNFAFCVTGLRSGHLLKRSIRGSDGLDAFPTIHTTAGRGSRFGMPRNFWRRSIPLRGML